MTNALLSSGLFGTQFADPDTARRFGAETFLARMLAVEAAWTGALGQAGAAVPEDVETALAAIGAFAGADFAAGSDRDGLPVPALVRALRAGLDPGPAAAIHTGLTSQDVIDTAMVLTLQEVLTDFAARIAAVLGLIEDLAARFGDRPLLARTRMQAALPATVALRLGPWAGGLRGQADRLARVRDEIAVAQVGGGIGARDMPEGAAEHFAAALGLGLGPVWHTDRSAWVGLGGWFALVTGSLGKIGQDLALMAQQGIDAVEIAAGGRSSAMPHKQNPVRAEALVALARYVAGQQGILAQAMVHEQERSGAAWALEWLTLPAMAEATGAALTHAAALLGRVERLGAAE